MIRVIFICLFWCFVSFANAKTYTLFNSGKTDYSILVSNDASVSEKYAASELQYWLKEVSGATFPIVNDIRESKGKNIIVGYYPSIMKSYKLVKPEDTDQGFVYGNYGDDIYIVGGRNLGTLYGVYSFLENELSCRWYTKDVSVAPKRNKWTFTDLYDKEAPAFECRNVYYHDALNIDWSLRNKTNGERRTKNTSNGSFLITNHSIWGTHTFNTFVPREKYFSSHPEYFSLRDGIRTKGQLCLSNSDVLKLCIENLRQIVKEKPFYHVYSITQNDGANPCQCNNCKKLSEKYGGESGLMIWFVNQIATSLETDFPDKYFMTFAYTYTRKAPTNIRPNKNVIIRLCANGCCLSHSLDLCEKNASFINDLSEWSNIASSIYLWDYVVSFKQYLLPFPNIKLLQRNIQIYKNNNVRGVVNEGNYSSTGGDFSELRAYLLAKLLWNPNLDVEALIEDFMKGYYQNSSSYMQLYFNKVQSLASNNDHLTLRETDNNSIYSNDFINSSLSILKNAEKASNSPEVLERVQRQKMVIAYLQCRKNPERALLDGSYDLVKNMTQKLGIKAYAEHEGRKGIDEFENKMEKARKSGNNKYSKEYLENQFNKILKRIKI